MQSDGVPSIVAETHFSNRMQLDFFPKLQSNVAGKTAAEALHDAAQLQVYARRLLANVECRTLASRVEVRWNARMRSTAGMAYPSKALVTLNPRLLAFGRGELDRTLKHELAHLVAHERAGRRRIAAHGKEWKKACADLGLVDETRCHNLALPKRVVTRRHFYECPNCRTELPRVRPLQRKSACLACCRAHAGGRYDERFKFVKLSRA